MPFSIPVFIVSLFFLSLFLALKEREVYSGSETFLTRFLVRHSPSARERWGAGRKKAQSGFVQAQAWLIKVLAQFKSYVIWTSRFVVVLLAHKAVKAVKGEKLLETGAVPSLYLKHLQEHKETISSSGDTISESGK